MEIQSVVRAIFRGLWAPALVFLVHVAAAMGGMYRYRPTLDLPMHAAGGIAIAYFFQSCIAPLNLQRLGEPAASLAAAILLFSLTATAAVFWEFAEYFFDQIFGANSQGGLTDTLLDIWMGMVGGFQYIAGRYIFYVRVC